MSVMKGFVFLAGTLFCVVQANALVLPPERLDPRAFARCPGGAAWRQRVRLRTPLAPVTPAGKVLVDMAARVSSAFDPAQDAADDAASAADEAAMAAMAVAASRSASAASTAADAADAAADAADAAADAAEAAGDSRPHDAQLRREIQALDAFLARHGAPTPDTVGGEGMDAMHDLLWRIAGDPAAQVRFGEAVLRAARSGDTTMYNRRFADVVDEALHRQGLPQRYGTLFTYDRKAGIAPALPIESTGAVEARRERLGLAPYALELCVRRESDSASGFWMFD